MADDRPQMIARFTFEDTDQEFEIDLLNLKAQERVELEEYFDQPWPDLWASGWLLRSTKGSVFLGYLARRRRDVRFTLAQALAFDAKPIEDEEEAAAESEEEAPAGGGKGKKKGKGKGQGQGQGRKRPTETPEPTGSQD